MSDHETNTLDVYYEHIMKSGFLLSEIHAKRWSAGVLKTLGTSLDRGTKKALAKALPEELGDSLRAVFWLVHFRDPNQTMTEFCGRVARRSGNSDSEFALHPTVAVFGGVRSLIDDSLSNRVAQSLSPQIREHWNQAEYDRIAIQE